MSSESGESDRDSTGSASFDGKRLIICCDGTWLDSDSSLQHGQIAPPSNVTRITRAIKSMSSDGVQQIVYYQAGVGSMGTIGNKVIQGISGDGLAEHVREAYSFIANNWNIGDEIFLIGFSRGAFTARSIGGVIANIGVMTKEGLHAFPVVYQDYAHRYRKSYRSPQRNIPFPNKPPFRDPAYARELGRLGMTTLGVRVKAIGVWDTVGSLGIPLIEWTGSLGQRISARLSDYSYYDTRLDKCIENAFQALALDEKRASFQPCVWEMRETENTTTNLVQMWFPGVHANIGGGYDDQELANISLAWMMSMLQPFVDMDLRYVLKQDKENIDYYKSKRVRVRPWAFGEIHDSENSYFKLGGAITRTPGDYCRLDPRTGEMTDIPLTNTNEYIHASVRARFVRGGPGYADKGTYMPKALRDYRVRYQEIGLPSPWYWQLQGPDGIILPEAPLRETELKLLRGSPSTEEYVLNPPEPRRSRRP